MAKRLLARVRELRVAKGLTQEVFAEKAGLKYKYYQQVEAGRRVDIRFSTLQKLAKACGLEPWELLNFNSPVGLLTETPPAPYLSSPPASARRPRSTNSTHPKSPRA
jgi:transcriptional regulator with XRE-family HTH domain